MGYKEKLEKSKSGEMKLVRRRFTDVEKYEENIMKLIEVSNKLRKKNDDQYKSDIITLSRLHREIN